MANYLLGVIGIAVSVGLFFIGYRQTVGAKKERIRTANAELEKILVRRIVLEKYKPNETDITRLAEGKARDYRIRPADLLSESQILNTVYTRVMESDLIPAEQRDEILERIIPALAATESAPVQEQMLDDAVSNTRADRRTQAAALLMAVLASLVGGLVAVFPQIKSLKVQIQDILPEIIATMAGSLTLIALLYSVYRLRASQEETSNKASSITKYIQFEKQVRKTLEDLDARVVLSDAQDHGFDFMVERGKKKILVEVKAWSRPVPSAVIERVAEQLREVAKRLDANESVIVTKSPIRGTRKLEAQGVRLMTIRELRNYLAHA